MCTRKWSVSMLIAVILMATIAATAALAEETKTPSHLSFLSHFSIVGSWVVTVDGEDGDTFFGTYNGGLFQGTVNFTSPNDFTSLTHGVWKRTGLRTFADTDIGFLYGENGLAESTIKFRAEIELDKNDRNAATFTFEGEITNLATGEVTPFGPLTATGQRVEVEPLVSE